MAVILASLPVATAVIVFNASPANDWSLDSAFAVPAVVFTSSVATPVAAVIVTVDAVAPLNVPAAVRAVPVTSNLAAPAADLIVAEASLTPRPDSTSSLDAPFFASNVAVTSLFVASVWTISSAVPVFALMIAEALAVALFNALTRSKALPSSDCTFCVESLPSAFEYLDESIHERRSYVRHWNNHNPLSLSLRTHSLPLFSSLFDVSLHRGLCSPRLRVHQARRLVVPRERLDLKHGVYGSPREAAHDDLP